MPNLSFIISTRNRLSWLEIIFDHLLPGLEEDEEIVVVDGDSTDGSKEYLQDLFNSGRIHQFISEPDRNQAHGWNKAMLMAKGVLIKKIIDDDVFCYTAIRKCKEYMLQNAAVDVVISKDLSCHISNPDHIDIHSRLDAFLEWKKGIIPSFTFGDVHLLIRKSALSFIGLYNTSFIMMDWEYSLRISYPKTDIVFYTGFNALSVAHSENITENISRKEIELQGKIIGRFYQYAGDNSGISLWSRIKIFIGEKLKQSSKNNPARKLTNAELKSVYNKLYIHLQRQNEKGAFDFIDSVEKAY